MKKIWWLVLALAVIGGPLALVISQRKGREAAPADNEPLVIARDTTRITEPLTPGGRVDYIAALNAVDVPAPEDNAALPMLRLLGANALVAGDRAAVLAQLGVTQDVLTEGSLVPPSNEFDAYTFYDGPLDDEAQKILSEWVAANDVAFSDILAATNCSSLWVPFVRETTSASLQRALPEPLVTQLSDLLRARAEIGLGKGELTQAWDDVRAMLRLYLLADQQRSAIGRIVAAGVRTSALDCVVRMLEASPPAADLCIEMLTALQALQRPAEIAYDYDVVVRYASLDAYMEQIARARGGEIVGINPVLRGFNADLDTFVARLRSPTPNAVAELTEMAGVNYARIKSLAGEFRDPLGAAGHMVDQAQSGGAHLGVVMGQILASMVTPLVPATLRRVFDPKRHQVTVALACHLYRLRNGSFPESLDELVPLELAALPTNDISGERIHYERTEMGCLIGPDGADEDDVIWLANK